MAIAPQNKKYRLVLLVSLFLSSSHLPHRTYGLEGQQKKSTTKVLVVGDLEHNSVKKVKTFQDIQNYAVLKNDPKASLPSSFTICVSVLSAPYNPWPILFSLMGNDGNQWFSAQVRQLGEFVGKKFFYPGANHYVNLETVPVFPNEWVRSCLAFHTMSGLVQWVARGQLLDNSTFAGITESTNIPKDLRGKLIFGCAFYNTSAQIWWEHGYKATNLNIFSTALPIEKMQEYTKGVDGCGEYGDYHSWSDMQQGGRGLQPFALNSRQICLAGGD